LTELENEQQIKQQKNKLTSLITITNYDLYQSDDTTERTSNEATDRTTDGQQTDTNKNVKNGKNKFSPPSLDEVKVYCQERGKGVDPEAWLNHYAAKGWMIGKTLMKDWRAAISTW
jgi:hypothetical protein